MIKIDLDILDKRDIIIKQIESLNRLDKAIRRDEASIDIPTPPIPKYEEAPKKKLGIAGAYMFIKSLQP